MATEIPSATDFVKAFQSRQDSAYLTQMSTVANAIRQAMGYRLDIHLEQDEQPDPRVVSAVRAQGYSLECQRTPYWDGSFEYVWVIRPCTRS